VNKNAVMNHLNEPGILDFAACCVETRSPKYHIKALPLAGRAAGVHTGRVAFKPFAVLPSLIDTAAIGVLWVLHSPTVEDLHLVSGLEIEPGIGAFRHHEFDVGLDVPMLHIGVQVNRSAFSAIDPDPLAWLKGKPGIILRVESHRPD
jgi:hypothetical protein